MATYEVTPGSQYDPNGACVKGRMLYVQYGADGKRLAGDQVPLDDNEVVKAAVRRVIATRQPETVVTHVPLTPEQRAARDAEIAAVEAHQARMERMMGADGDDASY